MLSLSTRTIHVFTLLILCLQNTYSTRYHVDPSKSSGGTGLSWTDAFNTLDSSLSMATKTIDEIWLKGGSTYTPSNPSDRTDCFVTNLGASIYGGFVGTETATSQRDNSNPPSIISGDIGVTNDITDNCYHVIQYQQKLTLDNVIIQHGNANYEADYTAENKIYAMDRYGGAIITTDVLLPTLLHLNQVIIRNNTAVNGGALWFAGGASTDTKVDVIIENSKFQYNKAIDREFEGGYGGAIYHMFLANITLINTEFNSNEAIHRGGAIYQDYGAVLYANGCTFDSNKVQGFGGAIFSEDRNSQTDGTTPRIISSIFRYNDAGIDGGAIFWYSGVIGTLTNNDFTSNTAAATGTAVSLLNAQSTSTGNVFTDNAEFAEDVIPYSDIDPSLVFDITQELTDLYSVFTANADRWDIHPFDASDALCYVDIDNTNSVKTGMTWNTAFTDLQQCLGFLSVNGGEIWVKKGVYVPTIIPIWKRDFGRTAGAYNTFEMSNGVRMYGGFDGTETSRDQRNWRDNPTYLSCQLTLLPTPMQCIQILNAADDTIVDGFIFTNAGSISGGRRRLANQISLEEVLAANSDSMGAGLLARGDTVHVVNSIFHKLYSIGKGGAVYCVGLEEVDGINKSPSFINVAFLGNRAQLRGGAISADVSCNFLCESCKFESNEASGKGGAIYLDFDCDPTFIDSVFTDNHCTETGGAIAADGQSLITFEGSNVFTSNSADFEGGCLYSGSGVSIQNDQGFVFAEAPVFESNYISNGGSGHSDVYGWPFSTIDLSTTKQPTTSEPTKLPTTLEPTMLPTTSEPTKLPTTLEPTNIPTTLEPTTSEPTNLPTTLKPTETPSQVPTETQRTHPTPPHPSTSPVEDVSASDDGFRYQMPIYELCVVIGIFMMCV